MLLGLFLVLSYSRAIEAIAVRGLYMGLAALLIVYAATSGRMLRLFYTRTTGLFLALTALMVPATLFGMWRTGSLAVLLNGWGKSLLGYFIVIMLVQNITDCRRLVTFMGAAVLVIDLLSFRLGIMDAEGRAGINIPSLSNPNDLAMYLMVALPFCICWIIGTRSLLLRIPLITGILYALYLIFHSGSRGALITFFVVGAVTVKTAPIGMRFLVGLILLLTTIVAGVLMPASIHNRYATILSDDVGATGREVEYAVAAKYARWALLIDSLRITASHPIFGVGPGNDQTANAALSLSRQQRASWKQTHNAYTQISSECGIPAGIIYLVLVFSTIRRANRLRKLAASTPRLQPYIGVTAFTLSAVVAYAIYALFSSVAYLILFPIVCGVTMSLEHSLKGIPEAPDAEMPVPLASPRAFSAHA